MQSPALQKHPSVKEGEISPRQGNALLHALRKISGAIFAAGLPENMTLSEALEKLDATLLSQPHKRHDGGQSG